jgi:hypothetical protein
MMEASSIGIDAGRSRDVLGVRAVEVVAEHLHVAADVLAPHPAEPALPAGEHGWDENPLARLEVGHVHPDLLDDARGLVAQHDGRLLERGHPVLEVVQVRVARAARGDLDEDLVRPDLRDGDVLDLEAALGTVKNRCFHVVILLGNCSLVYA